MTARIHPSAVIEEGARIGADVSIGPFCVVGPEVRLGDGCELRSHVVVAGRTEIGPRCRIFPFVAIGHDPQDLKYRGEPTTTTVGADCILREGVTIHRGTPNGSGATIVGDRCFFLANAHVAHDCRVGNNVILSNNVMLAGHVKVGDFAILGGGAAVIQHTRVGPHAFVGGMSGLENDLIPFGMAVGDRARLAGLNLVGLKRRGFAREEINALRHAFEDLFTGEGGVFVERLDAVAERYAGHALVAEVVAFVRAGGDRHVCMPSGPEPA